MLSLTLFHRPIPELFRAECSRFSRVLDELATSRLRLAFGQVFAQRSQSGVELLHVTQRIAYHLTCRAIPTGCDLILDEDFLTFP
jgi:hypothetical protein